MQKESVRSLGLAVAGKSTSKYEHACFRESSADKSDRRRIAARNQREAELEIHMQETGFNWISVTDRRKEGTQAKSHVLGCYVHLIK